MQKIFFVLGKNPTLSVAEIISHLSNNKYPYKIITLSREIVILAINEGIPVKNSIKELGGTVKTGEILDEISFEDSSAEFDRIFSPDNLIGKYFPADSGKIHLGISVYDGGGDKKYLTALERDLAGLNIGIKDKLRLKNFKVGFVRIKDRILSSVSVVKNELLSRGAEIVITVTADKLLIGKTASVQEFASFSFRDYGRPERDKRSGIMPPKLARIMINLAGTGKDATFLDPFCGSGTILQEEILSGYKNIIGCDNNLKAVNNSKTNIDWLFRNFRQIKRSDYNMNIFLQDVRSISGKIPAGSIDAIVTEPYLGPPLFKKPGEHTVNQIFKEVGELYLEAFAQFNRILKSKGVIVVIFPAFEENGKIRFLEILDSIKNIGFRTQELIPQDLVKNYLWEYTRRNTIIFGDKFHFVKREIIKFIKFN